MKILLLSVPLCLLFNQIHAQNVGIGTATPAARLDVKAATSYVLQLNGTAPMYAGIFENDIYRGYFGSYAGAAEDVDFGTGSGNTTGKLHLTIQSAPKLTIDAAGNVGIGTTSPGAKLEVAGLVKITGGSPGAGKVLTSNAAGLASWETPAAILWTSNGNHIYSSNTGSVGIGVTDPIGKLEVDAGPLTETAVRFKSSSDYGIRQWYMMGNDLSSSLVIARFGALLAGTMFGQPTPNLSAIYTNDLGVNALAIGTKNNIPLVLGTNNTERIFIDGSGNVGMGTATPGSKLEVAGQLKITGGSPGAGKVLTSDATGLASWATPVAPASMWTANGNHIYNNNSGFVGVGTNTPGHSLHVHHNGEGGLFDASIQLTNNWSGNTANDGLRIRIVNESTVSILNRENGDISIGTNSGATGAYGTPAIWIKPSGAMGIGTQTPDGKMEIRGVGSQPVLHLNEGFLKVSGTNKTAFTITGTGGNTSGHMLILNYANQSPTDILLVTHNYNPGGLGGSYHNNPVGVYWNGSAWAIYSEDTTTPMLGKSFNVMVVKQ